MQRSPRVFDIEDGHRRREVAAAIGQCHCCPALEPCAAWLAGLRPNELPSGVVAGRLVRPPVPKPSPEQPKPVQPKPPSPVDLAVDWLLCYLTGRGLAASATVKLDAAAAGINKHPLHAARARLRVTVDHVGKETFWSSPGGQGPASMKDVLYQSA